MIWCGPGDNGGDGYVIARHLRRRGWPGTGRGAGPARQSRRPMGRFTLEGRDRTLVSAPGSAALYIDCLFGAGLSRSLEGEADRLARVMPGAARIVAVDVPSGVLGDTGRPLGERALRAELTVTFHRRKPAHVLAQGRAACGEVVVADIGLDQTGQGRLFENDPGLWGERFPWPSPDAHKHARGRMMAVSGEAWNTGAARLAARGGLRIGAGVVTVLSPPNALAVNAAHLEAVMLAPFESEHDLQTPRGEGRCGGDRSGGGRGRGDDAACLRPGPQRRGPGDRRRRPDQLRRGSRRAVLGAGPRRRADPASRRVRADLSRTAGRLARARHGGAGGRATGGERWFF